MLSKLPNTFENHHLYFKIRGDNVFLSSSLLQAKILYRSFSILKQISPCFKILFYTKVDISWSTYSWTIALYKNPLFLEDDLINILHLLCLIFSCILGYFLKPAVYLNRPLFEDPNTSKIFVTSFTEFLPYIKSKIYNGYKLQVLLYSIVNLDPVLKTQSLTGSTFSKDRQA